MTNTTKLSDAPNPQQVVQFLGDRLRHALALIGRGGDDLAPLVLNGFPRGTRLLLTSLGAVKPDPAEPAEVVLTPFGHELVSVCTVEGLPRELEQKLTELEQELARRSWGGGTRGHADACCAGGPGRSSR